ncbi:MAG: ABC transporter substrate-binding protein [Chloroflexota bacterium]|nr:ABC transporter substrate-binding protein [Chloroflexota bacterium]
MRRRGTIPAILAAIGLMAAACTGGGGGTASGSAAASPTGVPTEIGEPEGELNLVIWAGYAERGENDPAYDWVTPFEDETGCHVNTTDMTDSANGVSLMQSGEYDGISASGDATLRLIAGGDVAPVNLDLIPNYENVFEGLKNQPHNTVDGVAYGVPHGRGANVLMYNTDVVTETPTSWDVVFETDSPYAGQISVYNSSIYIADAALYLKAHQPDLGIEDVYQLTEEQFNAAVDLLEQQSEIVNDYWSTAADQIQTFAAGDSVVGTTWQYQANVLTSEGTPVEVTVPEEGATGWSDTWMISSTAEHPNCMYLWMDHMLSPEASAQATVWFGEAPTSEAACEAAEELSPGHCDTFHATDEDYFSRIAYWSTPREDCNDDDDATTCKDVDDWIEAWTTITGG